MFDLKNNENRMFDLSNDLEIFENTLKFKSSIKLELKKLSDNNLDETLKTLVKIELKHTEKILWHIAEVDSRRLYLKMGYPSLFDYLTNHIGYPNATAQLRIDSARLLIKIPELGPKIGSGSLNLTQVSKLEKICREVKSKQGIQISSAVKRQVLSEIENKGGTETDLILAQTFGVEIKIEEKKHIQRDESVRVELTFSKEEISTVIRTHKCSAAQSSF